MEYKLYLIRKKSGIRAEAIFNVEQKEFVVLKGSIVSQKINHTEKFRGARSIESSREGVVQDGKLIKDVVFKSASTAANFVTGVSTNGLIAWKDIEGNTLKSLLSEEA